MSKSMVFYTDWFDAAEQLESPQEQLDFIKGILNYGLREIVADSDCTLPARLGYNICKGSIDTNQKKRDGGALGGAPKGNANAKKVESNQPMVETKQPMVESNQPTINVNVNDNVNGNVNVKGVKKAVAFTAPTRTRFIKPSIDEVKAYAKDMGYYGFNADRFQAYYESNGWKVGRNPMKDWKAAVRNWHAKDKAEAAPKMQPTYDELHPIGDFSNEYTNV